MLLLLLIVINSLTVLLEQMQLVLIIVMIILSEQNVLLLWSILVDLHFVSSSLIDQHFADVKQHLFIHSSIHSLILSLWLVHGLEVRGSLQPNSSINSSSSSSPSSGSGSLETHGARRDLSLQARARDSRLMKVQVTVILWWSWWIFESFVFVCRWKRGNQSVQLVMLRWKSEAADGNSATWNKVWTRPGRFDPHEVFLIHRLREDHHCSVTPVCSRSRDQSTWSFAIGQRRRRERFPF